MHASVIDPEYFGRLRKAFPNQSLYKLWLVITQDVNFGNVNRHSLSSDPDFKTKSFSDLKRLQQKETILRYQFINGLLKEAMTVDLNSASDLRIKLDRITTHKVWGYLIFFGIMLIIFQAIYDWSTYPMDFIDITFASLSEWIKTTLPAGPFTSLISEGIIPGLGGIVIFIPQIAFCFCLFRFLRKAVI